MENDDDALRALRAELNAIEVWDHQYLSSPSHDYVAETAFNSRQKRRAELEHEIAALELFDSCEDKQLFRELLAR